MKALKIFLLIVVLACSLYCIYGVFWMYRLNVRQNSMGDDLPEKFRVELPLYREPNRYFCITGKINNQQDRVFILDTKATSLARKEVLNKLNAKYWSIYPRPVRNLYGQQERLPLYELESIAVGSYTFSKPLFKGISTTNALHQLLYREVLGKDILKHFNWKFSLDDEKIILFSNKDVAMLESEIQGFYKIEGGLKEDNLPVSFPKLECTEGFDFDSGFQGGIKVNKKLFEQLKTQYAYERALHRSIKGEIDTVYIFSSVDIKIGNLPFTNCTLYYNSNLDKNMIGVEFMSKLNFILSYQLTDNFTHSSRHEDLYISPRITQDSLTVETIKPNLDFDVDFVDDKLLVTLLKIGGKADKAGLKIGDKVLDINDHDVMLDSETVFTGNLFTYLEKQKQVLIKVERNDKVLEFIIH